FLLLDKLIDQPYGFTGRPKEELTGLYYYRYRDYNPETGRFLQPDPLGQLPGPNIYSYCSNNPVNWVDPWGMRNIADQVEQTLNGVAQMASGTALVLFSAGGEVASFGGSTLISAAGVYIGVGTASIGFTNFLEGILNSGDQVMPESDTMPGIVAETVSGSETIGNIVDMAMPSAGTTNDIIDLTSSSLDIYDLYQSFLHDLAKNSFNETSEDVYNKKQ
ncbi:MAG: RHS repeat-associated core domain-containing protein, partial [Candidatus Omnitrophota bacterium]